MLRRIIEDKDTERIFSRSHILILFSGSINAGFSIFIMIIVARISSIEEVGILTIAFAISKLLMNIGKYGVRNYQVTEQTDINFGEWLCSRIITVAIMLITAVGYMIFQVNFHGYTIKKVIIVMLICMLYASECIEDIYTGFYQQKGRLDVSSLIQIYRLIAVLIAFCGSLVLTYNLLFTLVLSFMISALSVYVFAIKTLSYFAQKKQRIRKIVVKKILQDCFSLFLMSFLLIYISNAPKYEIDNLYTSDIQAYFGFISMPIFAISLFSGFIFQPHLANLSIYWKNREFYAFHKIVVRQLIYIMIVSCFCIAIGWELGIPFLSALYGVHGLENFKNEFLILLIGGAGTAIINFMSALLVIFRQQKMILKLHIFAGISIFITIKFIIRLNGIMGAVLDTTIWTWILALTLIGIYRYYWRRELHNSLGKH